MPRLYILIPCVLLVLFGGVYWNYSSKAKAEAAAIAAEQAKIAETQAAAQAAAEQTAREAAEQRAIERAAAEAKAEADRHEKWQAEQTRLSDEVAGLKSKADLLTVTVTTAEKTLAKLKTQHDDLRKTNLTTGLAVERLRIAKSTAELELQRLITLLARKINTTDPALVLP